MTPNIQVLYDFITNHRPGYTHIGIVNCRRIDGSQTFSQHSWANALDVHCDREYGNALAAELKEKFEPHIYELLWLVPGHFDHIHVSTWPKGWLTPPCAGGANRIKYEDETVSNSSFPLTINNQEGDEVLDFIINILKGQSMAFYQSLQAKTGEPKGNAGYWGYDYPGQGPTDDEWLDVAIILFSAVLQAGVFTEPGTGPDPTALHRGDAVVLS